MTSTAEGTRQHRRGPRVSAPGYRPARLVAALRGRSAPAAVLALGMAVQLVLVSTLTRGMWFEGDAWHYLTQRGTVPGQSVGWFAPWGGHWQTVPVAVYRGMFAVFGMKHYLPYLWLSMGVHLLICALLYALVVRSGASRWVAVAVVWLTLFFGAGAEAYFYEAPLPLSTGLCAGLGALLVLFVEPPASPRRVVLASLLLSLGVMSSGMGLVGMGLVLVHGALRGRLRAAAAAIAVPAALFLIWFVAVGRGGGRITLHGWEYAQIPAFMWSGFEQSTENLIGLPSGGALLVLALVAGAFFARDVPVPLRHLALTGLAGATAQLALNALASLTFGVDAAYQSRYQYLLVVQLTPAVCVGLEMVRRAVLAAPSLPRWAPLAVLAFILLASTVTGVRLQHEQAEQHRAVGGLFRAWAVGSVAATGAGEEVLTPVPDNGFLKDIDIRRMSTPQMRDALPAGSSPHQQLLAEAEFFVGVRSQGEFGYFGATRAQLQGLDAAALKGSGCQTYAARTFEPELDLSVGQGVEVGVKSESTQIVTTLTRPGVGSASRTWTVQPGTSYYIASSATGASLAVKFNRGGEYVICSGG